MGLAVALAFAPASAGARDLLESEDGAWRLSLRSSLKSSWLLAFPPRDALLPTTRGGGAYLRLRFDLSAALTDLVTANVAYEHRASAATSSGVGAGLVTGDVPEHFRLVPLEGVIVPAPLGTTTQTVEYVHRHELDRAAVALHLSFLDLTLGRQAIGLGGGRIFSAVDLFAPFSTLEVDREWRRGVDAVHAVLRIPNVPSLSADLIGVLGAVSATGLASWSAIGRVRALLGDTDVSLLGGRRDTDLVLGATAATNLGGAAAHGELGVFRTDGEGIGPGLFHSRRWVGKALLGVSYSFALHRGLHAALEYHYSGFGVARLRSSSDLLLDPAFQMRLARGDTQILGRHALALSLTMPLDDALGASLLYLQSPVDGSGLISPSLTWTASDQIVVHLLASLPWGRGPAGGLPRSEWGSLPVTLFLQARFYD